MATITISPDEVSEAVRAWVERELLWVNRCRIVRVQLRDNHGTLEEIGAEIEVDRKAGHAEE